MLKYLKQNFKLCQTCKRLLLKLVGQYEITHERESFLDSIFPWFIQKKTRKIMYIKKNIKKILMVWRKYSRNINVWKRSYYNYDSIKSLSHWRMHVVLLIFLTAYDIHSRIFFPNVFPASNRDQLFATLEFTRPEIKPAAWPIRPSFSLYPTSGPRKRILFTYSST